MNVAAENKDPKKIIPFVTEVARYFMDFLETDFHKVKNPKRYIRSRTSKNLQISINLNKYKKYNALVWKVIRNGFDGDDLSQLKRGVYTNKIPDALLKLIQEQIETISQDDVDFVIGLFKNEISLGVLKNPQNVEAAITFSLDGISRVLREKFLSFFVQKIKEPLEKMGPSNVDSVFQIEEELTNILLLPFEDVVSSIINHLLLSKDIDVEGQIKKVFSYKDVKGKIESFFKGFAATDLFFEVSELFNNKNLLEKQEFYLYFCDITYNNHTYPLFYVPLQVEKSDSGFTISIDALMYVNKKAVQYISQDYNEKIERKGTLKAFSDRIIYLAERRQHLMGDIDFALKNIVDYFALSPHIDLNNTERQLAKGQSLQVSNGCYIGLFDKSDESLINDYEEILQKLKDGDDDLAKSFQLLIDDFITSNPISVKNEVETEWDSNDAADKLVYASPVPLNEEQRQILIALNNKQCKYLTVEGPPGTGKSHTITAIACDAILKNQSILILSDKKEALDVVEDKLTETMNKVRLDNDFQNPILRLGRTGSTYTKILSTTSMQKITEHHKAVKGEYKKLEENINLSVQHLKHQIQNGIEAYEKIKLKEVAEFHRLEAEISSIKDLPVDLQELQEDGFSDDKIANLRNDMLLLKELLLGEKYKLFSLFGNLYADTHSLAAFSSFLKFLAIVDVTKEKCRQLLPYIQKINTLSASDLVLLEEFISEVARVKSSWFGFLFGGKKLMELGDGLSRRVPNSIERPFDRTKELKEIISAFRSAERLRDTDVLTGGFLFTADFIKSLFQFVSLGINIPSAEERKSLSTTLSEIDKQLKEYPRTASRVGADTFYIETLFSNKLTSDPDSEFGKLVRYLCLKNDLNNHFNSIPESSYLAEKKTIEELVTTRMTHKMDERVIDFFDKNRADARALAGVIAQKKKFDRASFDKLKDSFPCILAGIRDFAEFIPLMSEIFDLVIIDEASQVSIAQAFPALLRGKKIVVFGDKKQFSNVKSAQARSDTNREYLNKIRDVFVETISNENIQLEKLKKFDIKTSILEFSDRITNMNIMLKKHFRGYREIISYSSKYFYEDSLQAIKIRAKPVDQVIKFSFIEHDNRVEIIENSNPLEIDAIIAEIERVIQSGDKPSIGIITPHTNQQKLLVEAFSRHPQNELLNKDHKLKIMTFDTCQGEERDIIFYSMVASPVSDKLWGIFIKDRTGVDLEEGGKIKLQRLNVGFSRAKECMHFFLSKPIADFSGSIGEALQHYTKTLEEAKELPTDKDTDQNSPMEKKVLEWVQETPFFKSNKSNIELQAQFPIGIYLKQLDKRYSHPDYKVDFLLVYTDENKDQHKIIIEYDGFRDHFQSHQEVNEFNYDEYYTEQHVYREKVLESYGYNFLRINRFNSGKDPVESLNSRLSSIVKKKSKESHHLVTEIHNNIAGLQSGRMKECPECKKVKPLDDYKSSKLITGYGRICNQCKTSKEKRAPAAATVILSDVKCPRCTSQMVMRQRRRDKKSFYGCSRYPRCKGIRNI